MMSTQATLCYGDHFHFYLEIFDDANVYLELEHAEFKVSPIGDGANSDGCLDVHARSWRAKI